MFRIMFECWCDTCEVFEGTLEECEENLDKMENLYCADPWEDRVFIVDENGNEI